MSVEEFIELKVEDKNIFSDKSTFCILVKEVEIKEEN